MKFFYSVICFCLFNEKCFSQERDPQTFYIDGLPAQGVLLDKGWKFHAGDNPDWAKPDYDDNSWEGIDPTLDLHYLPQIKQESIGWLRIKLHIDSSLLNRPLAYHVYQFLASEIYLDGKLIKQYGTVSRESRQIKAIHVTDELNGLLFTQTSPVVAVRFSVQKNIPYLKFYYPYTAFQLHINTVQGAEEFVNLGIKYSLMNALNIGIFLVLTIIHVGLYLIFRKQKANLYFSISTFSGAIANSLWSFFSFANPSLTYFNYKVIFDYIFLFTIFNLFLFVAIHSLFQRPRNILFWLITGYSILSILTWGISYEFGELFAFMLPFVVSMFAALWIAWKAYKKGFRDSGIIVTGLAIYLVSYSAFICIYFGFVPNTLVGLGEQINLGDVTYHLGVMSVPVAMSLYLSRDFAFTSSELQKKLSEVQQLSAEKQQILISQKETLEKQVQERTSELKQSLEELKSTQAQLIQSEKMASLGELTAGIAHEIQNPLNFVNNFSDVNSELIEEMQQEIDKDNTAEVKIIASDIKENNSKIIHHGQRADAIVKGMLQHSRISTGQKEPTDINALADEYLRLSYHGLRAKDKSFNASMQTDFDESIGKVNIVPQDIGRVLLNLFNNAFYAVTEKKKKQPKNYEPTVTVTTKAIKPPPTGGVGGLEIRVKDNGVGIPQKVLDKIFQPFFTTKPTGQGTGLGLSLAYDIVTKEHGGQLKVETKEGEGAEFVIQLPVV